MRIKIHKLIPAIGFSVGLFDVLLIFEHLLPAWVNIGYGLPILLIIPGLLLLLTLGARSLSLMMIALSVGLSILSLISIGLFINTLLPYFGTEAPLNKLAVSTMLNFYILILSVILIKRSSKGEIKFPKILLKKADISILLLSSGTIVLAIFGAFRLNNGGSNIVSLGAISLFIITFLSTLALRTKLHNATISYAIFLLSLSVLLMTSLRSWSISGHDIRREFMVYNLTHNAGRWNMDTLSNAYNACLSITIFPEVLSRLLPINGEFFFKVIAQIIFAVCPLSIFVLCRRFFSKGYAFLGSIIFVVFPTFMIDSPMLVRQEIAILFFALAVTAWFTQDRSEVWLAQRWKPIFLLMSAGVILSHYSSTYMFISILVVFFVGFKIYSIFNKDQASQTQSVSLLMITVVFLGAFFWYSQTTSTSNNLSYVLKNSLSNFSDLMGQDNRDGSVNYIFNLGLSAGSSNHLIDYVSKTKTDKNQSASNVINSIKFADSNLPASELSKHTNRLFGLNLSGFVNSLYYELGPKIYQLLVVAGVLVLIASSSIRKIHNNMPPQLPFFCAAAAFILGLQIILPDISLNYGLMRAFQQELVFLVIPIMSMAYALSKSKYAPFANISMTMIVLFFMSLYSGLLPQLMGGVPAQLNLNNSGPYFDAYYIQLSDKKTFDWMESNIALGSSVKGNKFASAKAYNPTYPFGQSGILPFQLNNKDYVMLDYDQVKREFTYILIAGKLIKVDVPKEDYANNKNLLFSTSQTELYK